MNDDTHGLPAAWSRVRATARIAVRQVLRAPGPSTLVVALIALPILALSGGVIFYDSHQPTRAQVADYLLGQADSRIAITGGVNDSRTQLWDALWGDVSEPDRGPVPTTPPAIIPASADVVEITGGVTSTLVTETGFGQFSIVAGPVWEPRFSGAYDLVSGTPPVARDEVLASAGALARLGAAVGDRLRTATVDGEAEITVTVTGVISSHQPGLGTEFLAAPADSVFAADFYDGSWYVFGWQPTTQQVADLNHAGYAAIARSLVLDPPTDDLETKSSTPQLLTFALGVIGSMYVALVVALISGAAMSVSARRQQRSLAVVASVGADRGALFAIVIAQGVVLGLIAAILGIGLGAGIAALIMATIDNGDPWDARGNWGFHVPLVPLIAVGVLAVVVGALAAVLPARAATRGDTLAALRGARRPLVLRRRASRWGLGIIGAGVVIGVAGCVLLRFLSGDVRLSSPLGLMTLGFVGLGPLLVFVGLALSGHWLLTLVARCASRADVATRIAVRDAAANPSRTVPAFLAIASAMLVATGSLSLASLTANADARTYSWNAPLNTVVLHMWPGGADETMDAAATERDARALAQTLSPTHVSLVREAAPLTYDADGALQDPDAVITSVGMRYPDEYCADDPTCVDGWTPYGGSLGVIAADDIEGATGVRLSDAERAAFEDGHALVLADGMVANGAARLITFPAGADFGDDASALWTSGLVTTRDLPALVHADADFLSNAVVISPRTAAELGMDLTPTRLYIAVAAPLTPAERDRFTTEVARASALNPGDFYAVQERGPATGIEWLVLISILTGALVIGTAAITLGLARFERRPDDATLAAIGGRGGVRRRVNAVQAVAVVGIGSLVGAGIGLLPTFAFIAWGDGMYAATDVPVLWIGALALALPLVIALIAFLVPPHRAETVRRTAIA